MIHPEKTLDEPIIFAAAAEIASPNWNTTREHRAAISSRVRVAVQSAVENIPAPNWSRFFVLIRRVGANLLDDDNLVAACKPARDQIAQWLGLDDADSRVEFVCRQRVARERDENPKRKRFYRSWLEVAVSPTRAETCAEFAPPRILEREKTKAPIRDDLDKSVPIREIELPHRANGTRVRVSLLRDIHGERVRLCTAYVQQGHHWRTTGISLEMNELNYLLDVLRELSLSGPGSVATPRGVNFLGAREGVGSDTPSNNANSHDVGKGAQHPTSENRPVNNSPQNPNPPPPRVPKTQHLNPKPPPMPKQRRPPPRAAWDGVAREAPMGRDCNATAEDADETD